MNRVESAGHTDIGRKRNINQDTIFLDDELGLYVVADGMGGHKAGEVASRIVVDTLRDSVADREGSTTKNLKDATLSPAADRLMVAIHLANRNVRRASVKNKALRGMGSTISAIYLTDRTVIAANVGDSPIYLIHRDDIDEISVTHTLAAELAAAAPDKVSEQKEATRHILTQAIGARKTVAPHLCEVHGFPGDILVVCSDGLSNKVSKEEIRKAAKSMPPEQACCHLVDLANERGGEDNITVLITRIGSRGLINKPVIKPVVYFFRKVFSGFRNKH